MARITIKDYLRLKRILEYLEDRERILVSENNGYTCREADDLSDMTDDLRAILKKLEEE